jgi:chloramphenicol 3-O-phosphotransferase
MPTSPTPTTQPPGSTPSETVRAVVTCGLVLYLAGLFLALVGNTSSGTSSLVRTIKSRIYAPLLVPAWLDLGFDNHMTWGTPADADHALVIGRKAEAAATTLRFPAAAGGGERAARWRRLARTIAAGEVAGEAPAVLAAAVAAGTFTTLGTADVSLMVERTAPVARDAAMPQRPEAAYRARVRRVGDDAQRGDIQLVKVDDQSEVAPLARPRPTNPAPPASPDSPAAPEVSP